MDLKSRRGAQELRTAYAVEGTSRGQAGLREVPLQDAQLAMNNVLACIFFVASIKLGISTDILIQEVGNILEKLLCSGAAETISSLINSEMANQTSHTMGQVPGTS